MENEMTRFEIIEKLESKKEWTEKELEKFSFLPEVKAIWKRNEKQATVHFESYGRKTVTLVAQEKPVDPLVEKYVPKKYRHAVDKIIKDMDGYFLYLKEGYLSTTTECGTIHEYTIKDLKKELKTIVPA